MSAAETAPPPPEKGELPRVIVPSTSGDGGGDGSRPTPGLSPSTWKPNADAAEWTPSLGTSAVAGATPPPATERGENGTASTKDGESKEKQTQGELPSADGDKGEDSSAGQTANGGDANGLSDAKESADDGQADSKADSGQEQEESGSVPSTPGEWTRYEIAFLLKLRPKPEGTPKPAGFTPPKRADILWDGKEPSAGKSGAGSLRGGIRPLPPLGSRVGSSRGALGEARLAPPPLRGAQRDISRDRDNRMDRNSSSVGGGRDDRRLGAVGRDRGGGGGGGGRRPHVDTAPALEDCKPIEINEATRWKPKSLEAKKGGAGGGAGDESKLPLEDVLKKANAILNKMTLEKFDKLSVAFMDVGLRDPEVVRGVIDMIVDKAQMEHHFSSMYADLCERIARTPIPGLGEGGSGKDSSKGSKKFRRMLLEKCHEEFSKDWPSLFVAVQNDPKLSDDEKTEKGFILKRKYVGHMRFIGELYKVELLKEKHVLEAIKDMFGNADEPDEERLECMVKLLQTCGKKMEGTGNPETAKEVKRLFKRIVKLSDSRQVSSRVRFMLRDLIELQKQKWVPRREEEKAKTMQELHNDIAKEEESKNRASGRGGGSARHSGGGAGGGGGGGGSGGGSGGNSSSSIRPGSGDNRVSSGSRPNSASSGSRPSSQAPSKTKDEEGWETVPKKSGKGLGGGAGVGGVGGGGGNDGWSQVSSSRSRSSNPGSDERRGGGGGGSLLGQASTFALLGEDDDKDKKKKKKKDSKKEKSSKSGKDKKKSKSSKSAPVEPPGADTDAPAASAAAASPGGGSSGAGSWDSAPTMTEDTARRRGKDIVAEYATSGELEEACVCFSEVDVAVRWAAVAEALSDSMERKQKHREALAVVLVAAAKEGTLTEEILTRGLNDVLEVVPDVCIDVPQATTYVAAAVAPLVLGGHIALGPLVSSPCEGLMEGGKAAEFAVVTLAEVKAAAVREGMSDEDASKRVSELLGQALDVNKLASMLPFICRGNEAKAKDLLERKGVSL